MVAQTNVEPDNGRLPDQDASVTRSISGLIHDVLDLSELQARLLAVEARAAKEAVRTGVILFAGGSVVALAAIPVALLSLAEALVAYAGWSRTAGLLAASAAGLAIALTLIMTGLRYLRGDVVAFPRSRQELARNIAWIKSGLVSGTRSRDRS
jgi:hypothetical protein